MAKGFTKKTNGKNQFIPTSGTKKSSISSKDIRKKTTIQKSKGDEFKQRKLHTVKDIWSWKEADDDLQEKILEKLRQDAYQTADDFFLEDDGAIYDKDEKKGAEEIGLNNPRPSAYEVGGNRGNDYVQFDFEIKDQKKLYKYLGISDKLAEKVHVEFHNEGEVNTQLQFNDNTGGNTEGTGGEISLAGDTGFIYDHYTDEYGEGEEDIFHKEDVPTEEEGRSMLHAFDKFDDLMINTLHNITRNYEYQFEDEKLIEDAKANEWDFDKDGDIV